MSQRKFLQYELNWLRKFGFDLNNLLSIGEKPVEYVTGQAEFANLGFKVSSDTLIPRIETEEIIPIAVSFIKSISNERIHIADIGTGSGCVGITIAHNLLKLSLSNFEIYLSDNSPNALKIAKENSKNILSDKNKQIHFIESDLFDNFPKAIKFDLIIANLPYIPSKRIDTLDSSVKDFEPLSALDGGSDGTQIINHLLKTVSPFLKPKFKIILEIDSSHTLNMFSIPPKAKAIIQEDFFGSSRFLILTTKE